MILNYFGRRLLASTLFVLIAASVSVAVANSPDNPVVASFDGGELSLRDTEVFARELPISDRVPHIASAGEWRHFMARELGKCIIYTTQALSMGRQMDPGYLRAREYFLQEYLDFVMIRDNVLNKINVSKEAQEQEFQAHREDFRVTPTVTLRYIRTKDADKATSTARRLAAGEDFVTVEREVSEVSPRYIGRVLGPFPSAKARATIPPPQALLQAALDTPIGSTTGPLQIGPNYFLARTEAKTSGGLVGLSEVAEVVESRIREREGARLQRDLLSTLRRELSVQEDHELLQRKSGTRPDDVVATVGATLVTRQEFEDLNGRVRGPALQASSMERSRLAQFITPIILAEGARIRGYLDRDETKQAIQYYDLQHLSSWIVDKLAIARVTDPTEAELRERFTKNFDELKAEDRTTTPTFEAYRSMIEDTMRLERRPQAENDVVNEELQKRKWQLMLKQPCERLTAFEALVHIAPKLAAGSRILEIAEASDHLANGSRWYTDAGRNARWRITYANSSGGISEIISEGPGMMSDGSAEFTSCTAYVPYKTLWKFDTDSLFRHALDKGMGDFAAKYNNQLRISSRVEIAYADDAPTSPTDCLITYTAAPLDASQQDGFVLKYSGITGEITHRQIGQPEGPCPTCPAPDLPSSAVLNAAQGATTSSKALETSASAQAGR